MSFDRVQDIEICIPEKLINPIFNSKKKHRLLKGGRAGAKSESVARAIIVFCLTLKGNVLCTRSVQNAMKDSVYRLLVRLIDQMELRRFFSVRVDGITCLKNGNEIMFRGCNSLSDIKSEQAKGLDEVKICWFEEAHTATERDIEILLPSIRAEDCIFFWTYNSNLEPCFVGEYFRKHRNAEFTEIHYDENPFCPRTIIEEAEELKQINYQRYLEVYRGHPSTDTTKKVIILDWIESAIELFHKRPENRDGKKVYGLDVADEGIDTNALGYREGLCFMDIWEWTGKDTIQTTDWAYKKMQKNSDYFLIYDRVGVGAGVKARLREKYPDIKTTPHSNGEKVMNPTRDWQNTKIRNKDMFANFGAQHWFNVRAMFQNAQKILRGEEIDGDFITINPNIALLTELKRELLQIEFDTNNKGQIFIIKTPPKHKSPNLADAFMMSFRKPRVLSGVIS